MQSPHLKLALSATALVIANLITLAAVLWYGSDVRSLFLIYWLETAVIALYAVVKMVVIVITLHRILPGIFAIGAFLIQLSTFMFAHLFFICVLFFPDALTLLPDDPSDLPSYIMTILLRDGGILEPYILLPVFGFFISHGISFMSNFLAGQEYTDVKKSPSGRGVYGRILAMHITIILGGAALVFLADIKPEGEALPAAYVVMLGILVALKTGVDLWAHIREHTRG